MLGQVKVYPTEYPQQIDCFRISISIYLELSEYIFSSEGGINHYISIRFLWKIFYLNGKGRSGTKGHQGNDSIGKYPP